MEITQSDLVKASLYGFIIGDALGVPVEFLKRWDLKQNEVTDMLEYGTHNQPKGTWSDDSSMLLATIDGLLNSENNIDYEKIMRNFLNWLQKGQYTPFDSVFDIGISTRNALNIYSQNIKNGHPQKIICGTGEISSNGNGSLMRILPISLYLYFAQIDYSTSKYMEIINTISSMTHSHIYSVLTCYIYSIYVKELLITHDKYQAYNNLRGILQTNVDKYPELKEVYSRIIYDDISKLSEDDIKSSGYVVDTLESVLWSILNTNSFEGAVLKAVNLGDDTDTIGALTGALAGLIYGYDSIPQKWINSLQKKEYIKNIIDEFIEYLYRIKERNNKMNLNIFEQTINDLKNNPNACTLEGASQNEGGSYTLGESHTGEKLNDFINYFFENNLFDQNYLENNKILNTKEIKDMNINEVCTKLSWIISGDRFSSGLIYTNYKDGTILKLVERLYELSKKSN